MRATDSETSLPPGTPGLAGDLAAPNDGDSDARARVLANRYEIISLLGSGSMGTVYKARDLELEETVALKVLRADLAHTSGAIELFRREVKLARRVTHANVARVFDIGQSGDSKFLTMELVEGQSLAELFVKGRGMSANRLIAIAASIASGLAAAHAANVVHRDLKPANVLIADDGRVIVTDFGIAHAFEQATEADDSTTRSSRHATNDDPMATRELREPPVGSPAYMSPEQLAGSGIDPRSDIYSLGVLLYQGLSGALPTRARLDSQVRNHGVAQELTAIRPGLPLGLAAIVERCLATRPADRFAAAELAAALSGLRARAATHEGSALEERGGDRVDSEHQALKHRARRATRQGFAVGFGNAVELHRELMSREPNDPKVLAGFACAALWHWFYSGSEAERCKSEGTIALERALILAPDLLEARLVEAQEMWNQARPREAALLMVRAIELGDSLDLTEKLGFLMREAGMTEAARVELEKALRIDPESFAANMELSRLSALEGDWEAADRFLHRLTRPADPAQVAGRRRFRLRMALWRRDFDEARALMQQGEPAIGSLDMLYRVALLDDSKLPMQQFFKAADRRGACPRAVATLRQIEAEMACVQNDIEWALLAVNRAMEAGLVDPLWLAKCPLLDIVRRDPRSQKLLTRMDERAKLIREVYEAADLVEKRALRERQRVHPKPVSQRETIHE